MIIRWTKTFGSPRHFRGRAVALCPKVAKKEV